jgi:hypothetical protein
MVRNFGIINIGHCFEIYLKVEELFLVGCIMLVIRERSTGAE